MFKDHCLKSVRFAAGGIAVVLVCSAATSQQKPADHGFVLTKMGLQIYRGDEKIDCPDGRSPVLREAFLETQSQAERTRLLKPEHAEELERRYKTDYVFGPKGQDICSDPAAFDTPDRPLQRRVGSKTSYGFDLDGVPSNTATDTTCPHENFKSPSGADGVDNQFYRAIACNPYWRGAENGPAQGSLLMQWIDNPTVIVLREVDSWVDDPDVEVVIASAREKPALDATQKLAAGASLSITNDQRYRNVLRGRISDGVLTTTPARITLAHSWVGRSGGEFVLNAARLRVRLSAEGDLKGDTGGYSPIDNSIALIQVGGPGVAQAAGVECASVRKTVRLLADGDRDPRTGQCMSISTALDLEAKPAFIFENGVLIGTAGTRQQTSR